MKLTKYLWALLLLWATFSQMVFAQTTFKTGETVMVAFPANNIKGDAFIIGVVRKVLPSGDYQISVQDYVRGHNYGISCVPMPEGETTQTPKVNWEMWKDKTKLYGKGMQYIVKKQNVVKLSIGQHYFINRNNLLVNFDRWISNQPIIPLDNFDEMISAASYLNLKTIVPVLKLAKAERSSYYAPHMVPRPPSEIIKPLNQVIMQVQDILKADPKLNQLWRSHQRSQKELTASSYTFFMIKALDKIVSDASSQVDRLEVMGLQKVHPKAFKNLKKQIAQLGY